MTNTSNRKLNTTALIVSILITLAIGFGASLFTRPEIVGWFSKLNKPSFNPPNWLFAPVWTILYILIGVAAYLVWMKVKNTSTYKTATLIYVIQLMLNFSWSIVFFGMHHILGALVVIVLLWMTIILNMVYFSRFSKPAAWLLLPYLLWVSFATALNLGILLLNR
ncbi:MAG: TspO/MBR family protein [Mucilaginibacter sp.]